MANRETMNISLTPELGRFVNRRVKSGQYTSASEVVRESLRLLQHRETARQQLRKALNKGLNQARRGQLRDGAEAVAQLQASLKGARRLRKTG
jgi:antitoxin ParD1/3/4